jgi:hypothetical protein
VDSDSAADAGWSVTYGRYVLVVALEGHGRPERTPWSMPDQGGGSVQVL